MTLPNFLIIGAGRSGTTSLYHYLRQHPQIFMSPIKETSFFAFENGQNQFRFPIRSLEAYEALFSKVTVERAIGEASPLYLVQSEAADRIKRHIPDARLIALLRDPAERVHAAWLAAVRQGTERQSLSAALLAYRRSVGRESTHANLFEPGFYCRNLNRYIEVFGRERLSIHLYDDFRSDVGAVLRRIFRFLDVDDGFVPDVSVRYNASGLPRNRLLDAVMRPRRITRDLKASLPDPLRRFVVTLGTRINRRNLVKPDLSRELRRELIALYREDILALQTLLRRDLSSWLTVPDDAQPPA